MAQRVTRPEPLGNGIPEIAYGAENKEFQEIDRVFQVGCREEGDGDSIYMLLRVFDFQYTNP